MSIKYFKNKEMKNLKWENINREERPFCSELFSCIKGKEKDFVKFLKSESEGKLSEINANYEWDLGYEVCFYRDFLKMKEDDDKDNEYSLYRTFDLCLFSNKSIIIIEAKVQQKFKSDQLTDIKNDKKDIKKFIKKYTDENIEVKLISLASSKYYENLKKFGKPEKLDFFDCRITWQQLADKYIEKSGLFKYADELYKN